MRNISIKLKWNTYTFPFFSQIIWVLIMIPHRVWNWLSVHVANLLFQMTLNCVTQLHNSVLWITVTPGTYIISSSVDSIQIDYLRRCFGRMVKPEGEWDLAPEPSLEGAFASPAHSCCSEWEMNFFMNKWASLVVQTVKNLPAMKVTWVWSLSWEDTLKKGMATHSSFLAWRIPWAEELDGLESMVLQRVRRDYV